MDAVILPLQLEIFIKDGKGFVHQVKELHQIQSENEFKETEHKAGAMLQALKEASS